MGFNSGFKGLSGGYVIQVIELRSLKLSVRSNGALKRIIMSGGYKVCGTVIAQLFIPYTTNCTILKVM